MSDVPMTEQSMQRMASLQCICRCWSGV